MGTASTPADSTCVILQPSFLPWRGYFDQIRRADVFVFLDNVPFDARGWRNRNRIKTADGLQWLTVPVERKGSREAGTPIDEIRILWERDWRRRHRVALAHAYARAPFWSRYQPLLEAIYDRHDERLAELTIASTVAIAGELGFAPRFLRASELAGIDGTKTERLLSILRHVSATHYLSGPSAQDYLDVELLAGHGIRTTFMDYDYPEYPQFHPPFEGAVSILDLLFHTGPDARNYFESSS